MSDHGTSSSDRGASTSDHGTSSSDHGTSSSDHGTSSSDHGTSSSDHGTLSSGHGTLTFDHGTSSSGHGTPSSDHGTLTSDHGTSSSDHGTLMSDFYYASTLTIALVKTIYPNPANSVLHIDNAPNVQYAIVDLVGRVMDKGSIATDGKVDVSRLSEGTYFIKLMGTSEKTPLVLKFMVAR